MNLATNPLTYKKSKMATRTAKKVISTASMEDAQAAMKVVATVNSKLKSIEAEMELEKQKIDERYRGRIEKLNDEKKEPMETLEVFAKADAKNWENKSYDLTHGTIGFRTNPPKLEKKKGFTWEAITDLLKQYAPALVRTKDEPNKESIIAMRDDPAFEMISEKCRLSVVQDETFFVKTKEEQLAEAV